MSKLSRRLEAIASFVPKDSYLADVGSDHALLPIALLEKGMISYAQAIDNKMAPYLRMKHNVEEAGWTNRVLCSLSNGLDDLSPNADAVAICGIGGLLTCDILEKGKDRLDGVKTIILDPHRDLKAVRQRVSGLGYHIEDETMVYESRIYYSIMKWGKGSPKLPYTEEELLFGPILLKKKPEIFQEYLQDQLKKVNGLLNGSIPASKREQYLELYRMIKKNLA